MSETLEDVLAAHDDMTADLTIPRQFTRHGGWNLSCACGLLIGDAGGTFGHERVLAAHINHQADAVRAWLLTQWEAVRAHGLVAAKTALHQIEHEDGGPSVVMAARVADAVLAALTGAEAHAGPPVAPGATDGPQIGAEGRGGAS